MDTIEGHGQNVFLVVVWEYSWGEHDARVFNDEPFAKKFAKSKEADPSVRCVKLIEASVEDGPEIHGSFSLTLG